MAVDGTLLLKEVDAVVKNGEGYYNSRYEIKLLVNKKWITPVRITYMQLTRDYGGGTLGDILKVQFQILLGEYAYNVLPYRDNIIAEITEYPLVDGSSKRNWDGRGLIKRYKAVIDLTAQDNTILTNKSSSMTTERAMNQVGLKNFSIRLIDELSYKLMMVTVGTTIRQKTTMDSFLALHWIYANKLNLPDSTRLLTQDVAPGFSTEIKHQIAFPHGLNLKDVGTHLQKKEGGIYPTGFGRYIQDQCLYVFPLFDTTRYKKNSKVLNVINVPNDRYEGAEKTFIDKPKSLTIIATGGVTNSDLSLGAKIQYGNAVRFGDATKLLQGFGINKNGRMLIDGARNLYEITTKALDDGLNNTRWANQRLTGNSYEQYSTMAQKNGQPVKVEWKRGDPTLLTPGMAIKYQTIEDDTVKTYYGTLLGVDYHTAPTDPSINASKFAGIVVLTMFLSKEALDPSEPQL